MKPTPNCSIETASLADAARLRAIGLQTYAQHFSSIWTSEGIATFLERDFASNALRSSLCAEDQQWYLCLDEDLVGFAKVNWSKLNPITGQTGAELQKIYFTEHATGKGYGRILMNHVVNQARRRAQQSIWLDVLRSNEAGRAFYERAGFSIDGEIPYCTDLRSIGMYVMSKRID